MNDSSCLHRGAEFIAKRRKEPEKTLISSFVLQRKYSVIHFLLAPRAIFRLHIFVI